MLANHDPFCETINLHNILKSNPFFFAVEISSHHIYWLDRFDSVATCACGKTETFVLACVKSGENNGVWMNVKNWQHEETVLLLRQRELDQFSACSEFSVCVKKIEIFSINLSVIFYKTNHIYVCPVNGYNHAKFDVLTSVTLHNFLWDMRPCSLVDNNAFEENIASIFRMRIEAPYFSKTRQVSTSSRLSSCRPSRQCTSIIMMLL